MLSFRLHLEFARQDCDEAASALQSLVGPVRSEHGCTTTRLLKSPDDCCQFTWVEEWRGVDDFERHLRSPAFRQILAVIEMSDSPPEVEIDDVNSRRGFELIEELLSRSPSESTGIGTA